MKYLKMEEVILIHDELFKGYGGMSCIRDFGLLSSAISIPCQSFGGHELHPKIMEKAAAYLYHIIKNHPFIDGNKRSGVVSFLFFLDNNDVNTSFNDDFLFNLAIDIEKNFVNKTEVIFLLEEYFDKIIT